MIAMNGFCLFCKFLQDQTGPGFSAPSKTAQLDILLKK